jgi:FAD/FMN-containing dehydrogenase
MLETVLETFLRDGIIVDAVVAQTEAQRQEMWARREMAAELSLRNRPLVNNDIALPIDQVEQFLTRAEAAVIKVCPTAKILEVAHLGDGNVHYVVWPHVNDAEILDTIMETVEDIVLDLGGSFSAEHGIGRSKLNSMRRRKDAVALNVMRGIKRTLDPLNIMNPGKVIPD